MWNKFDIFEDQQRNKYASNEVTSEGDQMGDGGKRQSIYEPLTEFDIILNSRGATERLNESSGG